MGTRGSPGPLALVGAQTERKQHRSGRTYADRLENLLKSRKIQTRVCSATLKHCPWCVHSGAREALEVVLADQLHFGRCRPDAAELRADAKASRDVADE